MNSLVILPLLFLLLPSYITGQPDFIALSCSSFVGNYTFGSTYWTNLNNLLNSIAAASSTTSTTKPGFFNISSGQGPGRVNGIGLCRGDAGLEDCHGCITDATRQILEECPGRKEVVGFYDLCMIRYSNRYIYGVLDQKSPVLPVCNQAYVSDPGLFSSVVGTLLNRLRNNATASGMKFATGRERQPLFVVYGLVQCSPDLSSRLCDDCLAGAISHVPSGCGGKMGGRILKPSCNLRFETSPFYSETEVSTSPPPPPLSLPPPLGDGGSKNSSIATDGGSKNSSKLVAIVVPIVGVAALGLIIVFCRRKLTSPRFAKEQKDKEDDAAADEINNDGPLQFDFETIRAATNDFADESKLGQGGFGAVYKGTLPDGQDIAVKRLAKDSGQGDLQFKNEVKLVAKLQHRNLVRLLGFCLEGRERLLIYEFVPNASLDHFLFDKNKRVHLDWERRFKIIRGIARGLLYLHEDSRLRIIHRDLKTSNILLDADMNPKIADFGMARLFHMDETEGSTNRIVGTYGYMAPEYAMHGEFSVKSDVFSFEVLLLEIVCGQKNNHFRNESSRGDLLSYVWRKWNSGAYSNVMDPALGSASGNEIARCINIGLLCVQENANDRPTIAYVLLMLTTSSLDLQSPLKPAFFVHTDAGKWSHQGLNMAESDQSSGQSSSLVWSTNEASVTDLYPR